ncbi:bactofilin family protein [Fusobacterium perfoetens]|uniref:bactofilin family protein n=1 Tax=Fusobacterium perfoetens TaxID=852 RepID=UPI000481809B|nr:polymer-forming cytoskeletal protein [Fusobacterium perfoetens]
MAVFSRNDKTTTTDFSGKEITNIAFGSEIKGDLKIAGNLQIAGKISGKIYCNSEVVIGKTSICDGSIIARKITVQGKYTGHLEADYIELVDECVVQGEIISNRILMKEGVIFEGTSKHREAFLPDKNIILEIEKKK